MTKRTPAHSSADIDFMSFIAHQLSTPLAAIRWYGEMLQKGEMAKPLDKKQAELFGEIAAAASRMDELVDDMLNAAHLDQGKVADEPVPTTIADVVRHQHAQLRPQISAK